MPTLYFHKLHAAGNDFIVVARTEPNDPAAVDAIDARLAVALLDRHRGIGGDTLLLLTPGGTDTDCTMRQFESDGTTAEMTGNGIRCLAVVADGLGLGHDDQVEVSTLAGRRTVELVRNPGTGAVGYAWVAMGDPTFVPEEIPLKGDDATDIVAVVDEVSYRGDAVGVGNPHLVIPVDDVSVARVGAHGAALEYDPRFPNRTNVHWVQVLAPDRIRMRTWERGVGPTLACGTGATAAVAALHRRGQVGERVLVEVPGGELVVEVGSPMRLGGPVAALFTGTVDIDAVGGLPRRT
jgi:diaminopimelate epimerase